MGRFIAKEEKRGDSVVVAPCPMAWIPRIREPLWTKLGQQEERPKGEEHNTIVIITINITRDRLQQGFSQSSTTDPILIPITNNQ